MNKLHVIKIALLIVILAEEIKKAVRKEQCDICNQFSKANKLLYGEDYKICGTCADVQSELAMMD